MGGEGLEFRPKAGGGGGVAAPQKLFNQSYANKQFTGHAYMMNTGISSDATRIWNGNCIEPSTGIFFACDQNNGAGLPGQGILMEATPAGVITEHDVRTLYGMSAEAIAWSAVDNALYLVGYDSGTPTTYIYKITGPTGARVFTLQITGVGWHGIAIAIDQTSGDIWVSDFLSAAVHLFHVGSPITEDASSPIAFGVGTSAQDLAVDSAGDCWIATNLTHALIKVDIATLTATQFEFSGGSAPIVAMTYTLTNPPSRLAFNPSDGKMYVTGRVANQGTLTQFQPSDYFGIVGGIQPLFSMMVSLAGLFLNGYVGGISIHPVTGDLYFTNSTEVLNGCVVSMKVATPFQYSTNYTSAFQLPAVWGDMTWKSYSSRKCVFSNVGGVQRLWWADVDITTRTGWRNMAIFLDATTLWETLIVPSGGKKIRVRSVNFQATQVGTTTIFLLKFVTSNIDITRYGTTKASGPSLEGQYVEGAINEPVSAFVSRYAPLASIQIAYDEV